MRRIKEPLLNKNYAVMENLIFVHRGQFIVEEYSEEY